MSSKTRGTSFKKPSQGSSKGKRDDPLGKELRDAIRNMVANISKSFIVEWYTSISPTNHDFVASCEALIEDALTKLAELCVGKLDKYKVGQLVTSLLHDHILSEKITEKIQSIESQIDNHEYDICQNSVVRLFGLLCTDEIRKVIFTQEFDLLDPSSPLHRYDSSRSSQQFNTDDDSESYRSNSADTRTTSALYTLVIAMLTKAVFMPIVDSISEPNWLYAVIIWLCKKEEREKAKRMATASAAAASSSSSSNKAASNRDENCRSNNASNNGTGKRDAGSQFKHPASSTMGPPISSKVAATRSYRSLDLEEGIDMASANINFENPVCDSLKRPLDNIEICATEEVKSANSCYVLYCIRYDGLCHRHPSAGFNFIPEHSEMPIIDKRATHNNRLMMNEPSTSSTIYYDDMSGRKSFHRRMTIKRRFREFVILQLRLEENPKIRPYMKNIPKPTKLKAATQNIFSLPGITNIKLDQSTIKLRQRFLERFLIALNNSPFIANSYEFKEFFSYNVNSSASLNMSKSKSLILQVNLNKVFVDSLRSALSIIRSSLPGDDYHLGTNPNPDAWLIELQQSTLKLHVQTRTSHSKMNLERYIDSKLLSMGDSPIRFNKTSSLGRNYERDNHYQTTCFQGGSLRARLVNSHSASSNTNSSSLLLSRSTSSNSRNADSSSKSSSNESIYHDASSAMEQQQTRCTSIQICDSVPIASKLINIVHYSISNNTTSKSYINFVARIAFGKIIERYAIHLLEAALTLKNATFSINGITSSIWDESDDPSLDLENASLEEAVSHLIKLLEENYVNYPFIPKKFLNSLLNQQIGFYLSQLASKRRNKFVIYSFFVHLLDELESIDD